MLESLLPICTNGNNLYNAFSLQPPLERDKERELQRVKSIVDTSKNHLVHYVEGPFKLLFIPKT